MLVSSQTMESSSRLPLASRTAARSYLVATRRPTPNLWSNWSRRALQLCRALYTICTLGCLLSSSRFRQMVWVWTMAEKSSKRKARDLESDMWLTAEVVKSFTLAGKTFSPFALAFALVLVLVLISLPSALLSATSSNTVFSFSFSSSSSSSMDSTWSLTAFSFNMLRTDGKETCLLPSCFVDAVVDRFCGLLVILFPLWLCWTKPLIAWFHERRNMTQSGGMEKIPLDGGCGGGLPFRLTAPLEGLLALALALAFAFALALAFNCCCRRLAHFSATEIRASPRLARLPLLLLLFIVLLLFLLLLLLLLL
mmetsp:Transcript_8289/g.20493  ORF Transcript_8289/g.20493 Transcript_8289/m.20493 type:complete len:310 (-) Transcript_8289:163-1092(-)